MKEFNPEDKLTPQETVYLHHARIMYLACRLDYEEAVTYFLILIYQPE